MSNTNICWECRHDNLKLEIIVPNNCSVDEYVMRTGGFESEIVAIVKSNRGHYDVWFRSEGKVRLLSFRMLHVCKLKHKRHSGKVVACENYDLINDRNAVSDITYSKALNQPKNDPNNQTNPFPQNEETGLG